MRVLWLNGPHYVGKRTFAAWLRDEWEVVVLDGESVGLTLLEGLPARLEPRALQDCGLWLWAVWRVAAEMARRHGLAVVPATVYRPQTVAELLTQFRQSGVDVLHVVLTADERALRARIHDHDVSPDAKRWALEHLRPAVTSLEAVRDAVRLDATARTPAQLAGQLTQALVRHGWLTTDGAWTTPTAPGHTQEQERT